MAQANKHRKHSPAFKVEAVRVMHERLATGLTLQRVSDELDVGPDLLRSWAKQVAGAPPEASPEEVFPGGGRRRRFQPVESLTPPVGSSEAPEAELKRLRRENERLRQERDFLKKATPGSTDRCNSFGQLLRWCHES